MGLLADVLLHPSEVPGLVRFYLDARKRRKRSRVKGTAGRQFELLKGRFSSVEEEDVAAGASVSTAPPESRTLCWEYLFRTSRSFAAVIETLHPELNEAVCIFYLVLRGLDTVEDDVSIAAERKCQVLREFHKEIYRPGWTFQENRPEEKDAFLLKSFSVVIEEFLKLDTKYQEVISDIARRMGAGMAEFCANNKQGNIATMEEYNLYCHYVAGLVGIGLSRMFSVSGLESEKLATFEELSNSMGLFLQKTNIIRDYLEDLRDKRCWWPREVWGKYAASLNELLEPEKKLQSLAVLNALCVDALSLATSSLEYLSYLREPSIFHFCAIPQVMAVATLALVFNNPDVFRKSGIKIRKGEAVKCIELSQDMEHVLDMFEERVDAVAASNRDATASSFLGVALACANIKRSIAEHRAKLPAPTHPASKPRYGVVLYCIAISIPLLAVIYKWL